MYQRNHIELIGNLGSEPELAYTPTGRPYTRISLATNQRWKDASGVVHEETEWHTVIFWGPQAEFAKKTLHKGSFVFVDGALRSRRFTDKDGVDRRVWEVRARNLGLLSPREQSEVPPAAQDDNGSDADIPFI